MSDTAEGSAAAARPWTLHRRIGRTFAWLAVAAVVLLTLIVLSTVEFVVSGNDVIDRWSPANAQTQKVLVDLLDQETGVRGYALTRDAAFLEPYHQAAAVQEKDLERLHTLLGSDRPLQEQLTVLVSAAHRWQHEIAEPAVRGIAAGDISAIQLAESPRAKTQFDAVRTLTQRLSNGVRQQTDNARNRRKDFLVVFLVALAVAVAVVIGAGVFVWRGLRHWVLAPIERLGSQTRVVASGDTYRKISVGGPVEFTALGSDVEAMRQQIANQLAQAEEIQEELRVRGEELARSNDDLQQFAYVASHDLSEPLRKIANFCQLLERQYSDQLDDRARQYIDFAVDGAKRMQRLISDLLALSRVGRTTEQFEPVDLGHALDRALFTLADPIAATGAEVIRPSELPVVSGDQSLLTSLLENLVGNAIKYRREGVAPVVRIAVEDGEAVWTFTVSDNGIGIDQEYAERIFVVFQRLHVRDKYGGTGIGLALCRKIVEFHGGRIWLADDVESAGEAENGAAPESANDSGATFRFTVPKGEPHAEPRD